MYKVEITHTDGCGESRKEFSHTLHFSFVLTFQPSGLPQRVTPPTLHINLCLHVLGSTTTTEYSLSASEEAACNLINMVHKPPIQLLQAKLLF